MRKLWLVPAALFALASCKGGAGGGGNANVTPENDDEKALYALGATIGKNLQVFNLSPHELDLVKRGMTDQATGQQLLAKPEEYGPKLSELMRKRASAKADAEKTKGKQFLDEQAKLPGAQVLPDGMVYFEEKAGEGPSPAPTDVVKVNYRGTLQDGTEFDSSYKRGQPTQFPLNGVIKCWTEGVQKMKVGGKAKLVCPSSLAYGDRGAGAQIPGGATLVFEVELLDIVKPATPPAGAPGQSMTPAPGGKPGMMAPGAHPMPPPGAHPMPAGAKPATPAPAPKK